MEKKEKYTLFYAQLNQNDSEWHYHIFALDLSLSTCEKRRTMCKHSTENFIKWTREKPDAMLDQHQQRVCCARLSFCLSVQSQSNSFSSTFCIKYHFPFPLYFTRCDTYHVQICVGESKTCSCFGENFAASKFYNFPFHQTSTNNEQRAMQRGWHRQVKIVLGKCLKYSCTAQQLRQQRN